VISRCCGFGPLTVEFDERVLAPRPWTIVQSERAASRLEHAADGVIVELHCGAGHIGQATAALTGRRLIQVDNSAASCEWAVRNAGRNRVDATVIRAAVEASPLRAGRGALVLADPPYVRSADTHRYPDDPEHAIDGGADGLDGFRACLPVASRLLRSGGALVLQVGGAEQADAVAALACAGDTNLEPVDVAVVSSTRAVLELVRR
jgi:methylase of polypeptide subunit release factors